MSYSAQRFQDNGTPTKASRKRKTRREKVATGEPLEVKDKFVEKKEDEVKRAPIKAMTQKQQLYFDMLRDPDVHIIIATGLFGTGKTYLPSAYAADLLREHKIDKIIVARPYVQTGKTSGAKPGSSLQKLYPYVRTMLDTMRSRMGYGAFKIALDDGLQGTIEVQELESIRGRSFDERSYLILDEIQQSSPEEMLSIVTRVSDNCKLVLCGDLQQRDIEGTSGLSWFMDFAKRHNIRGIGIVDFNEVDDIVRGGIVKSIAVGLAKDETKGKWTPQKQR